MSRSPLIVVAAGLLSAALAGPAAAQLPGDPGSAASAPLIRGPVPIAPGLLPGAADAGQARGPIPDDTLPCPQCHPPKRFWMGLMNVAVADAVPMFVSTVLNDEEWAYVGPRTWANNFIYPWQWDDNSFTNNQFAHPYQGSMYYNAGRTNGYGFWASGAWAAAGSLLWEYFLEAWAPAPNDFVMTTLGGIGLGEALYRASRLPLDNAATGSNRTWREIWSGLLNPMSGLNRLLRGETHEISANPPDWRPTAVLGLLDMGYRNVTQAENGGPEEGTTQLNASFLLSYGDPVGDLRRAPFSYFSVRADLAGPSTSTVLNQVSARGNLAAWPLDGAARNQVALFLEYDYFDNPAFTYGGVGAQAGVVTSFGAPGRTWWGQTQVLVNGVLLGAVASDYYASVEGRNYDYGPGVGTLLSGRIRYKEHLQATVGYTGLSIFTVDGAESTHYQDATLLELRYWLNHRVGLGVSYTSYSRNSFYEDVPKVEQFASFGRIFASAAFPGLP